MNKKKEEKIKSYKEAIICFVTNRKIKIDRELHVFGMWDHLKGKQRKRRHMKQETKNKFKKLEGNVIMSSCNCE